MEILQKKCRTTGQKALAYREGGQNTDIAFLALRLGVVLYLLSLDRPRVLFLPLVQEEIFSSPPCFGHKANLGGRSKI